MQQSRKEILMSSSGNGQNNADKYRSYIKDNVHKLQNKIFVGVT